MARWYIAICVFQVIVLLMLFANHSISEARKREAEKTLSAIVGYTKVILYDAHTSDCFRQTATLDCVRKFPDYSVCDLRDAWGNDLRLVIPGGHTPFGFDLYSCGPNEIDEGGDGDDIPNWPVSGKIGYDQLTDLNTSFQNARKHERPPAAEPSGIAEE